MVHSNPVRRLLIAHPAPRGRGFTLTEILVAVTIVGLLAVIVVPVVLGRLDDSRAEAIATEMTNLQTGLKLFNRDVGRYPSRLDYLNVLPGSGVVDACGAAISAQNQAKFRGPYISRTIEMINLAGPPVNTRYILATGDSVESVLTRTTITNPVSGAVQQVLQIRVFGPEQDITETVDKNVDGLIDRLNGIVRYAAVQPNENTILWTFPIRNGAC